MKFIIYFILVLSTVSCTEEKYPFTYDFSFDVVDNDTNLKVKYNTENTYPLNNIVNEWEWVQACTGLSTLYAPLVIINETIPEPYTGYAWFSYNTIAIEEHNLGRNNVLKHEFIHILLARVGFDKDDNSKHRSNLFDLCAPL